MLASIFMVKMLTFLLLRLVINQPKLWAKYKFPQHKAAKVIIFEILYAKQPPKVQIPNELDSLLTTRIGKWNQVFEDHNQLLIRTWDLRMNIAIENHLYAHSYHASIIESFPKK